MLNAPKNTPPAMYPSIAWGTDRNSSNPLQPWVHLVWQQPDSTGFTHIWHGTIELTHWSYQSPTLLQLLDGVEKVSDRSIGKCANTMPCISVDASHSWTPSLKYQNISRIAWHAETLLDSLSTDRINYRERTGPLVAGTQGMYSAIYSFASGKRG
ncbi:MAG TPA: hypothetical protein VFA55_03045, partial [Candidatus Kapabacteria bacterium]|nr:hypothetical protein [Candidatus Kapabacteria bacterium]